MQADSWPMSGICLLACCSTQREMIGDELRKPSGVLQGEEANVRRLHKKYLIYRWILLLVCQGIACCLCVHQGKFAYA